VVTELEHRYPNFVGLNLAWETLEGVIKHNGPVRKRLGEPAWRAVALYDERQDLRLSTFASAEAQVAALADDIAYNNHDVDDGLQAGVFTIEDIEAVPLIGPALTSVRADYPGIDHRMLRLEAVRRMIGVMIHDVIAETRRVAAEERLSSPEDVRLLGRQMIGFSPGVAEDLSRLRKFLYERMYRHYRVNRSRSVARRILAEMFQLFMTEPDVLPGEWSNLAGALEAGERARLVCDYIAGMTDRFAIEEHRKLFRLDL